MLSIGLATLAAMVVWLYPSFREGVDVEQILQAYPEPVLRAFGVQSFATLEGFLAVELYNFAWLLLLGLYFAYSAAGLVSDAVEHDRMELLLSLPISRARVVAESFGSLLVPIVVANVATPVVVYVGSRLVDYPVPPVELLMVHVLSIPYLLACASVGLVASVAFDRAAIAQRVALGAVFALFLVETIVVDTDYEWLGVVAPMRHYDPNAILLGSEYDLVGAAALLAATALLVVTSQLWFSRTDIA